MPAIGAALDNGKTEEPYWKRIFSGFEKSQQWMRETKPDVAIIVYNDHASAFSVEMIPTFALGCAAEFPPADEGWGPRPVPVVQGHPALAWEKRISQDRLFTRLQSAATHTLQNTKEDKKAQRRSNATQK